MCGVWARFEVPVQHFTKCRFDHGLVDRAGLMVIHDGAHGSRETAIQIEALGLLFELVEWIVSTEE